MFLDCFLGLDRGVVNPRSAHCTSLGQLTDLLEPGVVDSQSQSLGRRSSGRWTLDRSVCGRGRAGTQEIRWNTKYTDLRMLITKRNSMDVLLMDVLFVPVRSQRSSRLLNLGEVFDHKTTTSPLRDSTRHTTSRSPCKSAFILPGSLAGTHSCFTRTCHQKDTSHTVSHRLKARRATQMQLVTSATTSVPEHCNDTKSRSRYLPTMWKRFEG